ncbi:MAG TPA: hypothetical protein VK901_00260 [Nitrospiraceae bacterium]|nr:hypothetical protein [Nitrospiraceae bacterium]
MARPESIIETHLLPHFGDRPLNAITTEDGQNYIDDRLKEIVGTKADQGMKDLDVQAGGAFDTVFAETSYKRTGNVAKGSIPVA